MESSSSEDNSTPNEENGSSDASNEENVSSDASSDEESGSSNASGEEIGPSNIHVQKRQRTEDSIRSAMVDFDVLDCPICAEPLTIPIFQCYKGHVACSSCSSKLKKRCPYCYSPIGQIRCRAMETVLASVFIPCLNAKFGCTEKVSYGKESVHKKECKFSPCSCPVQDCNFTGSYIDLYGHYNLCAQQDSIGRGFECGTAFYVIMNISDKIFIKREFHMKLLFAVQCFREPYGKYVNVSCIAPSSPEVGHFSYEICYAVGSGHTVTYKSPEVKNILEVNLETPQDNSMLIPHKLLRCNLLVLRLCIKKLNQED